MHNYLWRTLWRYHLYGAHNENNFQQNKGLFNEGFGIADQSEIWYSGYFSWLSFIKQETI